MERKCKLCSATIPWSVWIDGKKYIIKNRKYCTICSPIGAKNTKDLTKIKLFEKKCKTCGKDTIGKVGLRCYSCVQKDRAIYASKKVYDLVGTACWYCKYDKGFTARSVLDFHHVVPENKCFGLDGRNITNLAWNRVLEEMQKCVLLCCRCHREAEVGLIDKKDIEKLHQEKWQIQAHSSLVEHFADNEGVDGSIPSGPIYG